MKTFDQNEIWNQSFKVISDIWGMNVKDASKERNNLFTLEVPKKENEKGFDFSDQYSLQKRIFELNPKVTGLHEETHTCAYLQTFLQLCCLPIRLKKPK